MKHLGKDFDFVGKRNIFFIISLSIMAIGILFNIFVGLELDISFKGGTMARYGFTGEIDVKDIADKLSESMGMNPEIQTSSVDNVIHISFAENMSVEQTNQLDDVLKTSYPDSEFQQQQLNTLKPSMGLLFLLKCIVAIILSSIFLMIYVAIRFRKIGGWSAGAMSLIALLHDVLIAYFTFVILGIPLNDNFVAVVLTILGYSLNDTIIIYDRVRENRRLMPKTTPMREIVNKSINQSFTRSINVSLCTFFAIAAVAVLALINGLDSIVSFAVPMMIGIISGSYSTIAICGPLWVVWLEHGDKKQKSKEASKKTAKATK